MQTQDEQNFPRAPEVFPQTLEDKVRQYLRALELVKAAEAAKEALRKELIDLTNGTPELDAGMYTLKVSLRKRRNTDWQTIRAVMHLPDALIDQHTTVSEYHQVDVKPRP